MKRRTFLFFSSILGLSSYAYPKVISTFEIEFKTIESTLFAVSQHMFPDNSKIPSASSMNVTQFILETITHKSYDRDIREFVLEGAKELYKREQGQFVSMTKEEKERALRAYEKTDYGTNWLSRILTLTMEGMFSDPIYGSNIKKRGWYSLGIEGGFPRPKVRYLDV